MLIFIAFYVKNIQYKIQESNIYYSFQAIKIYNCVEYLLIEYNKYFLSLEITTQGNVICESL